MKRFSYAEEASYWKTSSQSSDVWMDRTAKTIQDLGGKLLGEGFIREPTTGRAAFMIEFQIDNDNFKIVWHILKSRTRNDKAAKIQAATALYHDVKAKCLRAAWAGARAAFAEWLLLPDGRTVAEASTPELGELLPDLFAPRHPALGSGDDFIEGEYEPIINH